MSCVGPSKMFDESQAELQLGSRVKVVNNIVRAGEHCTTLSRKIKNGFRPLPIRGGLSKIMKKFHRILLVFSLQMGMHLSFIFKDKVFIVSFFIPIATLFGSFCCLGRGH